MKSPSFSFLIIFPDGVLSHFVFCSRRNEEYSVLVTRVIASDLKTLRVLDNVTGRQNKEVESQISRNSPLYCETTADEGQKLRLLHRIPRI